MLIRSIVACCIVATPGLLAAPAPASRGSSPQDPPSAGHAASAFEIDSVHSMLIYRVRHFGVSSFYGRVNLPAGRFRVDDGDLAGSFVEITAELRHMDAGDDNRDRFLASPDFFNVREYPTATFRSSRIGKTGDGTYEATGSFTMHGVTREVTAAIEGYATAQTGRFGFRAGFEAILNVKRSDFGMDLFVKEGTLGDEVRIVAAIEGVQR